jgi:hypothetical protein
MWRRVKEANVYGETCERDERLWTRAREKRTRRDEADKTETAS